MYSRIEQILEGLLEESKKQTKLLEGFASAEKPDIKKNVEAAIEMFSGTPVEEILKKSRGTGAGQ
jgi:hypothetical protein